jgi:plastocyanin
MRGKVALLLATVVPAAFAAGCGGTGLSGSPVATNRVELPKSYRFDPAVISIKAGTSVTWTNHDNFTHTVKVEDGDDHKLSRGESVTISFPKPGTYHYVCTLHSQDMRGEVIVK